MKATELRIGNLVNYCGDIVEITSLGGAGLAARKNGIIVNCIYDAVHLHPIPLTEEILIAAGFKKTGDFVFDYTGNHGKCEENIVFDAPSDWNDTSYYPVGISVSKTIWGYNAECVIIRCLSLHELQNKVFECVGKELKITMP